MSAAFFAGWIFVSGVFDDDCFLCWIWVFVVMIGLWILGVACCWAWVLHSSLWSIFFPFSDDFPFYSFLSWISHVGCLMIWDPPFSSNPSFSDLHVWLCLRIAWVVFLSCKLIDLLLFVVLILLFVLAWLYWIILFADLLTCCSTCAVSKLSLMDMCPSYVGLRPNSCWSLLIQGGYQPSPILLALTYL